MPLENGLGEARNILCWRHRRGFAATLLEVQIDDAVLGGLHFDSDVNILLRRIVEPGAVCQGAKRLRLHAPS